MRYEGLIHPSPEAHIRLLQGTVEWVSCVPHGKDKAAFDVSGKEVDIYAKGMCLVWSWQLSYTPENHRFLLWLRTGGISGWVGKMYGEANVQGAHPGRVVPKGVGSRCVPGEGGSGRGAVGLDTGWGGTGWDETQRMSAQARLTLCLSP